VADTRLRAAATERNREPIAGVLEAILPARGTILEIASGSGEHGVFFARHFPDWIWQPSDRDGEALASIAAWREVSGPANLRAPLRLDAAAHEWPAVEADAILCINMIHITPWAATEGLMRGAARLLPKGAPLILYGPYRRDGVSTAPSNLAFDASLRARDPSWGLRSVEAVTAEAERNGLSFDRLFEMPANNLTLAFRRD
jgi:hypothetical protein